MKTCCKCHLPLPLVDFKPNKTKKDGLQSQCISCQKAYRRLHYEANKGKYIKKSKARRAEFIAWWQDFKRGLVCEYCGEDHPAALDFHHDNPAEKEGNVSTLVANENKTKLLEEVAKCRVLCSNCHRKLHYDLRV